jgi:cytochrome oxidase Cu insertion factor (SCO1/SenC/PrrC family)
VNQSKVLQWVVWSVLLAVIFGVVLAYLVDVRRGFTSGIGAHGSSFGKLPVIKTLGEFSLTNQYGSEISTSSLKGAPWVANIFFTRCPSICVQMTQRMKEIQDAVGADQTLKLISITTDPDFDQPEILEKYSRRFGA